MGLILAMTDHERIMRLQSETHQLRTSVLLLLVVILSMCLIGYYDRRGR